jgi:hypothetical protein
MGGQYAMSGGQCPSLRRVREHRRAHLRPGYPFLAQQLSLPLRPLPSRHELGTLRAPPPAAPLQDVRLRERAVLPRTAPAGLRGLQPRPEGVSGSAKPQRKE